MYQPRLHAYEGNEPYVFISYAHKDSDTVLPILDTLADQGYRVWYDDGIAPGSEWPENIATHLTRSHMVIAFISPRSIASANCRREVTFSLARNKTFLGIILEPTVMSEGMEMQLSAQQCILRHNFMDPRTKQINEDAFYHKLFSMEEIKACQMPAAMDARQPDLQSTDDVAETTDSTPIPAPAAVPAEQPEPPIASTPVHRNSKEKKARPISGATGAKERSPGKLLALIGACAVTVLLLLGGLYLYTNRNIKIAPNVSVSVKAKSLTLNDLEITDKTIASINHLKQLNRLTLQDCTFTGTTPAAMKVLPQLSYLTMNDCRSMEDWTFLKEARSLTALKLENCDLKNQFTDALPTVLFELDLSGNRELTQLPDLPGSLRTIRISRTGITDISAFAELQKLSEVTMDECTAIQDFSPLAQCRLTVLSARSCGITTLDDHFLSLDMKKLYLDDNGLQDVSCFDDMTRLESVSFAGNPITEASCLPKSAGTLEKLNLSGTKVTESFLGTLVECTGIKELNVSNTSLTNLDFARNMERLMTLSANRCQITDISGLANKPQLTLVYLADNSITDTTVLTELSMNDIELDLHNNAIRQCQLPKNVKCLLLNGNPASLLSTLEADTVIRHFVFNFDPCLFQEPAKQVLSDRDKIMFTYVIDAPSDQQMDVKDLLSKSYCELITSEQFAMEYENHDSIPNIYNWKFSS